MQIIAGLLWGFLGFTGTYCGAPLIPTLLFALLGYFGTLEAIKYIEEA